MRFISLTVLAAAFLLAGKARTASPGRLAAPTPSPVPTARILQENLLFQPAELKVRRGTTLHFPNRDGVFHSVYCASGSQTFDLGLHATGPGPSVLLTATGDLEIRCRVHRRMRATVHVEP
ncbi:MAG: hypothetical protein VKO21_07080 [Candidatus Sericytochromatia bacterium]|nr:hypothetical protein [Candidatus Sericytochromatia bacterium]